VDCAWGRFRKRNENIPVAVIDSEIDMNIRWQQPSRSESTDLHSAFGAGLVNAYYADRLQRTTTPTPAHQENEPAAVDLRHMTGVAIALEVEPMTKVENRCANCGSRFGRVSHDHWRLRFCRKACKADFFAKMGKGHSHIRSCFGFLNSRNEVAIGY
jgi:hypothetical protein